MKKASHILASLDSPRPWNDIAEALQLRRFVAVA
jgi:hypothetical protein